MRDGRRHKGRCTGRFRWECCRRCRARPRPSSRRRFNRVREAVGSVTASSKHAVHEVVGASRDAIATLKDGVTNGATLTSDPASGSTGEPATADDHPMSAMAVD